MQRGIFFFILAISLSSGCSNTKNNASNESRTRQDKNINTKLQKGLNKESHLERLGNITTIALGAEHTCALSKTGQLYCWGENIFGQLANFGIDKSALPIKVTTRQTFINIESGSHNSCGITSHGDLYCWGDNLNQQIGPLKIAKATRTLYEDEFTESISMRTPIKIDTPGHVKQIALGGMHSCLLTQDGRVACWGDNNLGQVGAEVVRFNKKNVKKGQNASPRIILGVNANNLLKDMEISKKNVSSIPRIVSGLNNIINITTGQAFSCALHEKGAVFCWGANSNGQLGTYDVLRYSSRPIKVKNLTEMSQIAAGSHHICGISKTRKVYCWGEDYSDIFGKRVLKSKQKNPFREIKGVHDALEIASGNNFSCARLENSKIICWGTNRYGQIGHNIKTHNSEPTIIPGTKKLIKLDIGIVSQHVCVLENSGEMLCWGLNRSGQLGNGSFLNTNVPTGVMLFPVVN